MTDANKIKFPAIILSGPQEVGKTRHSAEIAKALNCHHIVDDWNGTDALRDGTLAITNSDYEMPEGAVAFHVEDTAGMELLAKILSA